jgi:hypothetical protein
MEVIWKFDPSDPDDNGKIRLYQMADGMHSVLWHISQKIRDTLKYQTLSEDSRKTWEELKSVFNELIDEYEIDLDL